MVCHTKWTTLQHYFAGNCGVRWARFPSFMCLFYLCRKGFCASFHIFLVVWKMRQNAVRSFENSFLSKQSHIAIDFDFDFSSIHWFLEQMYSTWLCRFHQNRNKMKIACSDNFNILTIQFSFWNIFDILSKWNFGIYFYWLDLVPIVNFEQIISKLNEQSSWLWLSLESTKMCELS